MKGKLVSISSVNDPTFAQEMLGQGVAIIPEDGTFVSPVKGTVQMVFETKHAVGILSDTGVEILLHVGLDTVNLKGKYYEALVKDGDTVDVGTPLLKADPAGIRSEGYDVITPIIITNTPECTQISKEPEGEVEPKAPVMKVVQ